MSTVAQVRSIVQDKPQYFEESVVLSGTQTTFQLKYSPVITTSLIINTAVAPSSVDEETGVVTWLAAPIANTYTAKYSHVLLSNTTVQDLINLESDADDPKLCAANCLDAMAVNQVLIQKKIKMLDLSTDGPSLASALTKVASSLREQVYSAPDFDLAEQVNDTAGYVEKLTKDYMRELG